MRRVYDFLGEYGIEKAATRVHQVTPNGANISPIGTNNPPIGIHWNVMARAKFKFGANTSQHEPIGRQFAPLHPTGHLIGDTRRHSKLHWRTLAHTVAG